jgi:ribonuclease HI
MYADNPDWTVIAEATIMPAKVLLDHHQQRYIDRLASLPTGHMANCAVPSRTISNTEDPTDPDYEPSQRTKSQTTLTRYLHKYLKNTINPKSGMEPITRTNPVAKGKIIINNRESAIRTATEGSKDFGNIFPNVSCQEMGNIGCSVVWIKRAGKWKDHKYSLGNKKEIFEAELFAIAEALKIANRHVIENKESNKVTIYSDSTTALNRIKVSASSAGQWITKRIKERENILTRAGWTVEYRWVPGHEKIEGNERSDAAVKDTAQNLTKTGVSRPTTAETSTSISHINRVTKEKCNKETKAWIFQQAVGWKDYEAPKQLKLDPKAMTAPKHLATRYYQQKTGRAVTYSHLKRIKILEDDRCWWCSSGERQTVHLLIKVCMTWSEQRKKLRKALPASMRRQKDIQHLFSDRKKTTDILTFLKDTEVGNRRTAKEMRQKEIERDQG